MLRREGRWVDDRSTNLRIHVQTREEGQIFRTWANSEELAETFQETDVKENQLFNNVFLYHAFCFLPKSWELIGAIWPGTYCRRECVPFAEL